MPESFSPLLATPAPTYTRGKRRLGTFLFILALLVIIFFGYRVFNYYRQIQAGTIDPTTFTFEATQADQSRLVSIAKAAPGSGELATADDPALGPADAKLTIVQFADFGCPYSEQESYVVRAITQQYPNDVRVIYRDFPLVDLHPGADLAAQAGGCAHEQGKFWEYHDLLYRNSGTFTEDALIDYAAQVGVNTRTFRTCLESGQYADEVAEDMVDGVAAGVTGTPAFFMNGEQIDGAIPYGTFVEIVKAFLAE